MSGILRDASHLLASQHREIVAHFAYALDLVLRISDCPFLFVTGQFVSFITQTSFFGIFYSINTVLRKYWFLVTGLWFTVETEMYSFGVT